MSLTIPAAVHTALVHKHVTVHLANGLSISGRLLAYDPESMNVKLDALTSHSLRRPALSGQPVIVMDSPPQLPAVASVMIRGPFVQWIDVDDVTDAAVVQSALKQVK